MSAILAALNFDPGTPLSLANISAIYRRGWLAQTLRLRVRELLALLAVTGLDPFTLPTRRGRNQPGGIALPAR